MPSYQSLTLSVRVVAPHDEHAVGAAGRRLGRDAAHLEEHVEYVAEALALAAKRQRAICRGASAGCGAEAEAC